MTLCDALWMMRRSVRAVLRVCVWEVFQVLSVLRAPNIGGHRKLFCRKAMLPLVMAVGEMTPCLSLSWMRQSVLEVMSVSRMGLRTLVVGMKFGHHDDPVCIFGGCDTLLQARRYTHSHETGRCHSCFRSSTIIVKLLSAIT